MPKVSVIVPVYGVEKFIERCANSLFNQTLNDMEFIFVDDCTPDRSIEILKSTIEKKRDILVEKNYTVRIEHMPTNSGLPAVRKYGLQFATGNFVIHCDSDDWADVTMYEKLYNKAVEENADVVMCDFYRINNQNEKTINIGAHTIDKQTFILNCLFQKDHWSLCNKLFKRTVYYKEIHYPAGALGEDMVLCLQLLNKCGHIAYVNEPLYFYYFNSNSITKKKTADNCLNNFYTLKENTDFISCFINEKLRFDNRTKKQAISYLRMINSFSLLGIKHIPQYRMLWKEYRQRISLSFFCNRRISLYNKVLYCLSFFPFYPLAKNRAIY